MRHAGRLGRVPQPLAAVQRGCRNFLHLCAAHLILSGGTAFCWSYSCHGGWPQQWVFPATARRSTTWVILSAAFSILLCGSAFAAGLTTGWALALAVGRVPPPPAAVQRGSFLVFRSDRWPANPAFNCHSRLWSACAVWRKVGAGTVPAALVLLTLTAYTTSDCSCHIPAMRSACTTWRRRWAMIRC